ncbi:MAG: polysaccharide deacetylase family protein [Candidatus Omnitrophica bacterium]|nr:polysaccharide deacetylase family protein [Candidatus Omnitrophota bacterium]
MIKRISKNIASNIIFARRRIAKSKILDKESCRILAYHAIESSDPSKDLMGLAVLPSVFEMHMRYLKEEGFCVIGLLDLAESLRKGIAPPKRSIVITFDDGYKSILTNAMPIVKKFDFKATLFVNIYFLEQKLPKHVYWHSWQTLDWGDLIKLGQAGFSIGSHALTHKRLTEIDREALIGEIAGSRETIEKNIHDKIYAFSFPHGKYTNETKNILKQEGFLCACSSVNGINDKNADIFTLKRTEITGFDDSPIKFEKKLLGCYDWLGSFNFYASNVA